MQTKQQIIQKAKEAVNKITGLKIGDLNTDYPLQKKYGIESNK